MTDHPPSLMPPPFRRTSRLRRSPALRRLNRETRLHPSQFIWPLFISESARAPEPIPSLPGVSRWPLGTLGAQATLAQNAGLGAVLLFGIPEKKDGPGTSAWDPNGVIPRAIREIKMAAPDLVVISDVCLCEYTENGHCGHLKKEGGGDGPGGGFDLSSTLDAYQRTALAHAQAGADVVAPSGMMDGQVAAIRGALDSGGFSDVAILAYSIKYASCFYGPFRDAAGGAPAFGDRRSHQLDVANFKEGLAEADADVAEGADALMVKPAMLHLDQVARLKERHPHLPLAAYQVSGEYAMLCAGARAGVFDLKAAMVESALATLRAGADWIISYGALDTAKEVSP